MEDNKYKQIVELSPDAIFIHRDNVILYMNKAGLEIFGASKPEQIINQSLWQIFTPDRHGIVRARNQEMLRTREAVPMIEQSMMRLDGRVIYVEAIARLIEYEGKDSFYVQMRDITERKKTSSIIAMQHYISKELVENNNLNDAMYNVLSEICKTVKFATGSIWVHDKKANLLRCAAFWNSQHLSSVEVAISREAIMQPIFSQEISTRDNGEVLVPIVTNEEVFGLMQFKTIDCQELEQASLDNLAVLSLQLGSYIRRVQKEKELSYTTKHDILTGLANRFLFAETLAYELNIARDNDQKIALIFLDLDDFTSINEALGHIKGDQILVQLADMLRATDTTVSEIARFGADQFTIVRKNIGQIKELSDFIQKLQHSFQHDFTIDDKSIRISASFGISIFPDDAMDADNMLRSANIALNDAKAQGKGSIGFCNVDMAYLAKQRRIMETELQDALENSEFVLYYQPLVDARTRVAVGMESLLRWVHNGKFRSPQQFIPLLENNQLIVPVGEWILTTACKQMQAWNKKFKQRNSISVNISQTQFEHADIAKLIGRVLESSKLNPACLKVELTESIIMHDPAASIKVLEQIKAMGVHISIDDLGTGYSSLNYLRHLPIDYLKIDKSFVDDVTTNDNDVAIVRTIIDLANNLGYKVIAEGVETEAQLEFLAELGCHEIQGYYFGRPMAVDEATGFLQNGKLI